jgi:hypothetical protein
MRHIVPQHLGIELADYIFGLGGGSRLLTADKCLLMHRIVERSFDNGNIIIPVAKQEELIRRWKIIFTNKAAKNQYCGRSHKYVVLSAAAGSPSARIIGPRPAFSTITFSSRWHQSLAKSWRISEEIHAISDGASDDLSGTRGIGTPDAQPTFAESVSLSAEEEAGIARRLELCTERKEECHEGGESDTESSEDDHLFYGIR